jgi:hypothetical protein
MDAEKEGATTVLENQIYYFNEGYHFVSTRVTAVAKLQHDGNLVLPRKHEIHKAC